jgi:hypothetical protein
MSRPPATASARPLAAVPDASPTGRRCAARCGHTASPAGRPPAGPGPPAACWAPVAQPSPRQLMTDEFVLFLRAHTNRVTDLT